MKLVAIVLTYNEEEHIERCLKSLEGLVSKVFVVDSYSTDKTVSLAQKAGAEVLQNPWKNHATQFNWGLSQLSSEAEWIIRIDADEYLSDNLVTELRECLPEIKNGVDGITVKRNIIFAGKKIRYGGVLPVRVLRVFRYGCGRSDNRWMDEYISVKGKVVNFNGEIIDDNLNSLTWWTAKHNLYSSREALEQLNLMFGFMPADAWANLSPQAKAGGRRWMKEKLYSRLPSGARAFLYFIYRYFVRLGFLDGKAGAEFHFLQGLWYRYLVDAKVREVLRVMRAKRLDVVEAIDKVLDIKL